MRRRRDILVGSLWLLPLLLTGCGADAGEDSKGDLPAKADGPAVIVEAKVDKPVVDIGDRVRYRVEVRRLPGYEVEYPLVPEQFANSALFDVQPWRDEADLGKRKVRSIELVLDPGLGPTLKIPETIIRWRKENDESEQAWQESRTEPITVEVTSTSEGAPEFREPKEPLVLPDPARASVAKDGRLPLLIGGGALLVLGLVWLVVFRKRRQPKVPVLPPHEVAQRELAHLEGLGLIAAGRVQEYYFRLTGILRRYVEQRFGIMAPERTTEEFLREARESRAIGDEHKAMLRDFLSAADLVKFARFDPGAAEAATAWQTAERFVKTTIVHAAAEGGEEERRRGA